jgi:DNA repair exonuclease SbcCD ATPase subunit
VRTLHQAAQKVNGKSKRIQGDENATLHDQIIQQQELIESLKMESEKAETLEAKIANQQQQMDALNEEIAQFRDENSSVCRLIYVNCHIFAYFGGSWKYNWTKNQKRWRHYVLKWPICSDQRMRR